MDLGFLALWIRCLAGGALVLLLVSLALEHFTTGSYNMKAEAFYRVLRWYFAVLLLVGCGLPLLLHDWSFMQNLYSPQYPAFIEFLCAHVDVVVMSLAVVFFLMAGGAFVYSIYLTVGYVREYR